jgi:hypothetical protein
MMNERIKELGKQAMSATFNKFSGVEWSAEEWRNFYDTKFAELIAEEMCQVMKVEGEQFSLDQNFDAVKGVGRCMRKVKEHFGVEE